MNIKYESLPMSSSPIRLQYFADHFAYSYVHWHNEIEILFFTKGKSSISCNLKEIPVKKGDIVIINSKELHTGTLRGYGSAYYCVQLNTAFFHNLIGREYVIFKNLVRDEECARMFSRIIEQASDHSFSGVIELKKQLYKFFSLICARHVSEIISEDDYKKQFCRLDTFNAAVEYINRHYNEDMSVSELANKFFISPSYFSHLFKKNSGKGVIEYVNEVRIARAKSLLESDDTPIGDIALLVGFGDINYFSRKFKELTGVSPSEHRKRSHE